MESFRPQKSPSSDRFLGLLSSSPPDHSSPSFEFHEDDIFDSNPNPNPNPNPRSPNHSSSSISRPRSFNRDRHFGILAALPEESSSNANPFLGRKSSISSASESASPSPSSSARMIPVAPKPKLKPDSFPIHQHSAPVNVPVGPGRGRMEQSAAQEEEEEEEMMLPPHEIVDRAHGRGEPMTTFSVLEGVGRTLKGRDLRRVRNAVWRQTGFLD